MHLIISLGEVALQGTLYQPATQAGKIVYMHRNSQSQSFSPEECFSSFPLSTPYCLPFKGLGLLPLDNSMLLSREVTLGEQLLNEEDLKDCWRQGSLQMSKMIIPQDIK